MCLGLFLIFHDVESFFLKFAIFSVYRNNYLDPEYRKFLESYAADNEKMTSTPETLLEEIEAKNRELIGKWATGIKGNGFFIRRPDSYFCHLLAV